MKFQKLKQIKAQNQNMKVYFRFLMALVLMVGLGVYDFMVLQGAKNKVEQIAEKEMPLLITEKGLMAALEASQAAVQGFVTSGGDELYKTEWQKQNAIFAYHREMLEKAGVTGEITQLLVKNKEWFTYMEKEIMSVAGGTEELSEKQKSRTTQISEIETGYMEQIEAQKDVIQKLEQEVIASEKMVEILIGMMSLILAAAGISGVILLFKKVLTLKGIKVFSKVA